MSGEEHRGTAMLVSTECGGLPLDASEWLVIPAGMPVSRLWSPSSADEWADTDDGSPFPVVMHNREYGTMIAVRLTRKEEIGPDRPEPVAHTPPPRRPRTAAQNVTSAGWSAQ